jgi:hypothetical protein
MKPRTAGILTMVGAFAVAVFGGSLFANPWTAIAGAVILFAVGAVWTLRKSWDDRSWPPDVHLDTAKALRRQRRAAIITCGLAPILVGASIAMLVIGEGDTILYVTFIAMGLFNLLNGILLLRAMTKNAEKAARGAGDHVLFVPSAAEDVRGAQAEPDRAKDE